VHFRAGCDLGFVFDLRHGCPTIAVVPPPPCALAPAGAACIAQLNGTEETTYITKVVDTESFSSLVSDVTTVEGAGWGMSASVGVSVMQSSDMSAQSISFVVGAGIPLVVSKQIQNPGLMSLLPQALALLQRSPQQFMQTYGLFYVYKIDYGGSFMGSVSLMESKSGSTSSLSAYAKFSAKTMFFSASASTEFASQLSKDESHLKAVSRVKHLGGDLVSIDPSNPLGLGDAFRKWHDGLKTSPSKALPVRMEWRRLYDIAAVQDAVNALNDTAVRKAFMAEPPSSLILSLVVNEYAGLQRVGNQASQALSWACAATLPNFRIVIGGFRDRVTSRLSIIDSLTTSQLMEIETQVQASDYSWFVNHDDKMQYELSSAIRNFTSCNPQVHQHQEIQTSAHIEYNQALEYLDRFDVNANRDYESGYLMQGFHLQQRNGDGTNLGYFDVWRTGPFTGSVDHHNTQCDDVFGHGLNYLDRHNVECPSDSVLGAWRMSGGGDCQDSERRIDYYCHYLPSLGTCRDRFTSCQDYGDGSASDLQFFDRQNVKCYDNEVLQRWQVQTGGSCPSSQIHVDYRCCEVPTESVAFSKLTVPASVPA